MPLPSRHPSSPHPSRNRTTTPGKRNDLRAVVSAPHVSPMSSSTLETPAWPSMQGRVVDVGGRAVAGIEVFFELTGGPERPEHATAVTTSDVEGAFELPLFEESGRLRARGKGYRDLISPGVFGTMPPEPLTLVVGPEVSYSGLVVGEDGQPVPEASFTVQLPSELAEHFVSRAFGTMAAVRRGQVDDVGEFEIEAIGFGPGIVLSVGCPGYELARFDLPGTTTRDLLIELAPLPKNDHSLGGVVLDGAGSPVEDAYVSAGDEATQTDEAGRFTLADSAEARRIRAVKGGHLPASLELDPDVLSEPHDLELVLGGEPLSIGGRVVDAEGEPIEGARVWTRDGDHFGMLPWDHSDVSFWSSVTTEDLISGVLRSGGRSGFTAERGTFELTGLLDRTYTLFALHPRTMQIVRADHVSAGRRGLTIVLGGEEPTSQVAGRVVDSADRPVVGAEIRVHRKLTGPDGKQLTSAAELPSFFAVTDEEGRFRFDELCIEGTALVHAGDVWKTIELENELDLMAVEFRTPALCHFRVVLDDPDFAHSMMAFDEDGEPLFLTVHIGTSSLGADAVFFDGTESDVIETSDLIRTLVFYGGKDDTEVHRMTVELTPGEVMVVRP